MALKHEATLLPCNTVLMRITSAMNVLKIHIFVTLISQ